MDENLDSQKNSDNSTYATPFSVDLFSSDEQGFFEKYTRKVFSLPTSIKDILMDTSTTDFIEEHLGSVFGLNLEQKTWVTRVIRDVLLGDLFIGDMITAIAQKLNIDSQVAQQIMGKIINELFATAIEDIKKIQREKFPDRVGHGNVTTNPANAMPRPPTPPQMKNGPPVNQNNIVDLRNLT